MIAMLMLAVNVISAQDTYYYKQIKIVKPDNTSVAGSGGQFISFFSQMCWESRKDGGTVNNGKLFLKHGSTDSYIRYEGKSYWGDKTIFKFTNNKDSFTVTKDNTTYYYQRATAPAGVTTCSLIKSKSSGGSTVGFIQQPLGTQNIGLNGGQIGEKNQEQKTGGYTYYESVYVDVPCEHCKGSTKCQTCDGKGWYKSSFGDIVKCPNCYGGNQSGKCNWCEGKGTRKKRQDVIKTR